MDNQQYNNTNPKKKATILKFVILGIVLCGALAGIIIFLISSHADQDVESVEYSGKLDEADQYLNEEDYDMAETTYLDAIELEPQNRRAYLKLSDAYVDQKKYKEAADILEQGIEDCGDKSVKQQFEKVYPYYGYEQFVQNDLYDQYGVVTATEENEISTSLASSAVVDVNDDEIPELITVMVKESDDPMCFVITVYTCQDKEITETAKKEHSCGDSKYDKNTCDVFLKNNNGNIYLAIQDIHNTSGDVCQKLWLYGIEEDSISQAEEFTIDQSTAAPKVSSSFDLNGEKVGYCSMELTHEISSFKPEQVQAYNDQYRTGYNAFIECLKNYGLEHLLGIEEGNEYYSKGFNAYEPDADTETYLFNYSYHKAGFSDTHYLDFQERTGLQQDLED